MKSKPRIYVDDVENNSQTEISKIKINKVNVKVKSINEIMSSLNKIGSKKTGKAKPNNKLDTIEEEK